MSEPENATAIEALRQRVAEHRKLMWAAPMKPEVKGVYHAVPIDLLYEVDAALASLAPTEAALRDALRVGPWSALDADGMKAAFVLADEHRGLTETLFAVCAFILRKRLAEALAGLQPPRPQP